MQIINNTEVFEPNECYFYAEPDPEDSNYTMIFISPIDYWDENECLDDSFADHSLPEDILPDSIGNLMEATWSSDLSVEEVNNIMTTLGFVHNDELQS